MPAPQRVLRQHDDEESIVENQTNGKDVSADFLPLIPISSIDDTKNALRRTFRSVVRQALALDPCARAVKPFKTNGDVFGHKVLDDGEAVKALAKAAPENLRTEIGRASCRER